MEVGPLKLVRSARIYDVNTSTGALRSTTEEVGKPQPKKSNYGLKRSQTDAGLGYMVGNRPLPDSYTFKDMSSLLPEPGSQSSKRLVVEASDDESIGSPQRPQPKKTGPTAPKKGTLRPSTPITLLETPEQD